MSIHGVSSAVTAKTPTPASERLLADKKRDAQAIIDAGIEQTHAKTKVIDLQTHTANQARGRGKKEKEQFPPAPSAQQALADRQTVLDYRHKLYNADNVPLAISDANQRQQALTTYGPVYQHDTAVTLYSTVAKIGYQQACKIQPTLDLLA